MSDFSGVIDDGERNVIIKLFDCYADSLTGHQRDIMELYYNEDLSLAEIADNSGVTRQGVFAAISQSKRKLKKLEQKYGFVKKTESIRALAEKILQADTNGDVKNAAREIVKILD